MGRYGLVPNVDNGSVPLAVLKRSCNKLGFDPTQNTSLAPLCIAWRRHQYGNTVSRLLCAVKPAESCQWWRTLGIRTRLSNHPTLTTLHSAAS